MANDNNIKNFTAADIEKYHLGQLSAKEMHALEKAALDDPFLADALEGYSVAGVNVTADITDLKKRLSEKTEQAKVIPMQTGGRSSFPWLRAAIMVILIAGAGTLAYQFLFKAGSKDNSIAKISEKNNSTEPAKISPQPNNDTSLKDVNTEKLSDHNTPTENKIKEQHDLAVSSNTDDKPLKDSVPNNFGVTVPDATVATTTPKSLDGKTESYKFNDAGKRNMYDSVGKSDIAAKTPALNKKAADKDADGILDYYDRSKGEVVSNGVVNRRNDNNLYRNTNVFRGRVTDGSNNALPFANVTNNRDNVGTYSDAQGNFTLVSTDTVLDVQVRSLGFQNRNVQLRNAAGLTDNRVMLQEDRNITIDTLDKVKRNISSKRNSTMTFEEPEPEDGWDSYGSYVVNNLNIPETFDMKKGGETTENTVEVSFEVNKNGEPVNIKVEKSLCDKCDKEAIRLIKEGPKWKRKAKKSKRTTVTVPFIKPE